MSTKPLIAVAAVAAVLTVSAGFPLGQSATGLGVGAATASPCPPFLPCQGPPKPPKMPGVGGGSGPKGPRLPDFGGGGGGPGPKLPDLGGGGPGPKLPDLGGGGPGPSAGPRWWWPGPKCRLGGGGPAEAAGPRWWWPGFQGASAARTGRRSTRVRRGRTSGGSPYQCSWSASDSQRHSPRFPGPRARAWPTESRRPYQLPLAWRSGGAFARGFQGQLALAGPTARTR